MAGYAFSKREDIEKVLRLIGQSPTRKTPLKTTEPHRKIFSNGIIAQTPSGGIAARSGTTVSSAECTPVYIDGTTLTTYGSGTITVYNIAASAIAGTTYITAKLVGTNWVADAEDCG